MSVLLTTSDQKIILDGHGQENFQYQQHTIDSLQALISNDPTDAMNPIFQEILDQYTNVMNMTDEQVASHAANMNL